MRSEDVAHVEVTVDGVVHRVPITPEQARRWVEGQRSAMRAVTQPLTMTAACWKPQGYVIDDEA
jgi:hypothetical protein